MEHTRNLKLVFGKSCYRIMRNNTLNYYNTNANSFVSSTLSVDLSQTQDKFLLLLPPAASILDFGCGSGRDTKYFLDAGMQVDATDGSEELCRLASEYTGIPVRQMLFEELDAKEQYDGIWACSSILHLPKDVLKDVLKKMIVALKENGIIYTSFKYGMFEGERNGRFFTDFTEETFQEFVSDVNEIKIEESWIAGDVRPGRGDERWLNLILRKI